MSLVPPQVPVVAVRWRRALPMPAPSQQYPVWESPLRPQCTLPLREARKRRSVDVERTAPAKWAIPFAYGTCPAHHTVPYTHQAHRSQIWCSTSLVLGLSRKENQGQQRIAARDLGSTTEPSARTSARAVVLQSSPEPLRHLPSLIVVAGPGSRCLRTAHTPARRVRGPPAPLRPAPVAGDVRASRKAPPAAPRARGVPVRPSPLISCVLLSTRSDDASVLGGPLLRIILLQPS